MDASLIPIGLVPLLLLLATSAIALVVVLRLLPPWTLHAGSGEDTPFLARFSIPETSGATTFRWSMKHSRLMLHGTATAPFVLSLRLHGDERTAGGEWAMTLEDAEHMSLFGPMAMAPGWRVYQVLVPQGMTSEGLATAPLVLSADSYRRIAGDERDLGVPLDWLHVAPLRGDVVLWWPALWRGLAYTWLLGVVAALLWRVDTMVGRGRSRLTPVRVTVITALLAVLLVGWAWVNPYTLAWALPPLPWALALATLFLLTVVYRPMVARWLAALPIARSPVVAVVLLLVAQGLFFSRVLVGAGLVLALVGVVLLAVAPPPPPDDPSPHIAARSSLLLLVLIVVVALALRFYRLDSLPYALWRDEANHALIALRILENPDYRPVYAATTGVNMPALGLYPFALALKVWGIHIWSMRPVTALAGALTVVPLYGVVSLLTRQRTIGLLAAALLAVSSWHITISRFSFPAVFDPLLTLTGVWLLLWGMDDTTSRVGWGRWAALVGAGVCTGLAVQTYHTGRLAPVLLGGLFLLLLLRDVREWRRWLVGAALVAVGFGVTVAPLVHYAVTDSDVFNSRVNRVFLLREAAIYARAPLAALDDALGRHMMMFNLQGDSNGRHHAPYRPMLDVVSGLGFLAGCGVLLQRWRTWQGVFIGGALVVGLLPSLLAVQGPHGMRSIDAAAFACMIAAIGWGGIVQGVAPAFARRLRDRDVLRVGQVRRMALVVVVVVALGLNARVYFVTMPVNPAVWLSYYPIHTHVGGYVREHANAHGPQSVGNIYVPAGLTGNSVFVYLTHQLPVPTFEGRTLSRPAPPDARFVLSGYTYQQDEQTLAPYLGPDPTPVQQGPLLPGRDMAAYRVYAIQSAGKETR